MSRLWRGLKRTFQIAFGGTDYQNEAEPNVNNCAATQFRWEDSLEGLEATLPKRPWQPSILEAEQNNPSEMNYASLLPLKQLLTCNVCFDFAKQANQCANGHLICLPCSARLEQVSFSVESTKVSCSCPICRVSLRNFSDGRGMQRCLLAEKLAAEIPIRCKYCEILRPRKMIDIHQRLRCTLRPVGCRYSWLGCDWKGIARELDDHLVQCPVVNRNSTELIEKVHHRLKDIFTTAAVRLNPWRNLLQILEDRQQMRFGRRFHSGLRLMLFSFTLDKVQAEGSDVSFKGHLICIPLVKKQSLWVQVGVSPFWPFLDLFFLFNFIMTDCLIVLSCLPRFRYEKYPPQSIYHLRA